MGGWVGICSGSAESFWQVGKFGGGVWRILVEDGMGIGMCC